MPFYLACDLGAESGRLILGSLEEGRLSLEEVHRFPNIPFSSKGGSLQWNISSLMEELGAGLKTAAVARQPISSISTDSWGVDYVLLNASGDVLPPAFHYRDPRTSGIPEQVFAKVPWTEIFAETGIQFMQINTLFQLAAEPRARLEQASLILGIGDAFNFFLSGRACAEASMASTTQLYNPRTRAWSDSLIERLNLPRHIFPPIVAPGTRLGPLTPDAEAQTGLHGIEVVAGCSHDTGAAVVAVPSEPGSWAYLSSGTWSLMGIETAHPILSDLCRELNFTNEIGHGYSVRVLKNIIGLWLVQECRRAWAQQGTEFKYAELTELAREAQPFQSLIHPGDPRFLSPHDMPSKIASVCVESGQAVPATPGATIRAVLESLALLYRRTLAQIEQLTGTRIERLHVVGGGSKNSLLNQFTANALQIPVLAGPVEATAAGNVLLQAMTLGHVSSIEEARGIVRNSFPVEIYEPRDAAAWNDAAARFDRCFG